MLVELRCELQAFFDGIFGFSGGKSDLGHEKLLEWWNKPGENQPVAWPMLCGGKGEHFRT